MKMNRVAINIVAVLVLVGGFLGYRLYQAESDRTTISKEFDAYRQEQTARLSAAEAALKADQERIAEEEKKAADAEQRRKAEEQRRLPRSNCVVRKLCARREATGICPRLSIVSLERPVGMNAVHGSMPAIGKFRDSSWIALDPTSRMILMSREDSRSRTAAASASRLGSTASLLPRCPWPGCMPAIM